MRETTRCWAAQSRSTSSRHGPRPERIAAGAKAPSQNRLTSDRNFRNPIGPCSTATRASRRRLSRRICRPCPAAACACHRHRRSASMRSFSPLRSGRSLQDEEQQRMWRLPLLDETGSLRRAGSTRGSLLPRTTTGSRDAGLGAIATRACASWSGIARALACDCESACSSSVLVGTHAHQRRAYASRGFVESGEPSVGRPSRLRAWRRRVCSQPGERG
jgi:hypothetical protein